MWWGGASRRREPSNMPAGYASQTGYQYDSISRVAGQRELAPPSKFSKDGGFKNSVFKGMRSLEFYTNIPGFGPNTRLFRRLEVRVQWRPGAASGAVLLDRRDRRHRTSSPSSGRSRRSPTFIVTDNSTFLRLCFFFAFLLVRAVPISAMTAIAAILPAVYVL